MRNNTYNNEYKVVNRFVSCNENIVTVIINGAACTMPEKDYNWIVQAECRAAKKRYKDGNY